MKVYADDNAESHPDDQERCQRPSQSHDQISVSGDPPPLERVLRLRRPRLNSRYPVIVYRTPDSTESPTPSQKMYCAAPMPRMNRKRDSMSTMVAAFPSSTTRIRTPPRSSM